MAVYVGLVLCKPKPEVYKLFLWTENTVCWVTSTGCAIEKKNCHLLHDYFFNKNKWNVLHAKKDLSTQLTDINGETDTVRGRINSWAGRGITFSYFHTLSMAESYGFKSETISSFHGTI